MPASHFEQLAPAAPHPGPAPAYTPTTDVDVNELTHTSAPDTPAGHATQHHIGAPPRRSFWSRWLTIQPEIETVADTLYPESWSVGKQHSSEPAPKQDQIKAHVHSDDGAADGVEGNPDQHKSKLDKALDWGVQKSGSITVFVITQGLLWAWVFLAFGFYTADWWQVVISDAQAIYSYALDSVLMHQQLNELDASRYINGQLQSRNESKIRMLNQLARQHPKLLLGSIHKTAHEDAASGDKITVEDATAHRAAHDTAGVGSLVVNGEVIAALPQETWVAKVIRKVSLVMGHLLAVMVFWAGFFVWIGTGPSNGWSDTWQLYYNAACSGYMVMIFSLLTVTGETYATYRRACIKAIKGLDRAIERDLRLLTGDQDPNPSILLKLGPSTRVERWIASYAFVVGTLVGILLLIIVIVVWILIGPAMHFNSNWWLIIGTYAGLIGLHDSFVLRHMQMRCGIWSRPWIQAVVHGDEEVAALTDPQSLKQDRAHDQQELEALKHRPFHQRWSEAASNVILKICASSIAVVGDVIFIIGLVAAASALKWSVTGQLICNNPPGILESFLMQILISGLNAADAQEQKELKRMYDRRVGLLTKLLEYRATLGAQCTDKDDGAARRASCYPSPVKDQQVGADAISVIADLPRTLATEPALEA